MENDTGVLYGFLSVLHSTQMFYAQLMTICLTQILVASCPQLSLYDSFIPTYIFSCLWGWLHPDDVPSIHLNFAHTGYRWDSFETLQLRSILQFFYSSQIVRELAEHITVTGGRTQSFLVYFCRSYSGDNLSEAQQSIIISLQSICGMP